MTAAEIVKELRRLGQDSYKKVLLNHVLTYSVKLTTVTSGWDGKKCWVHSRAGAIPPHTQGNPFDSPIVVMTTQKLRITGSDIFDGLHDFRTDNLGVKWTGPARHASLDRRPMGPPPQRPGHDSRPAGVGRR